MQFTIRKMAAEGVGILVFSSEYDEIAALCDRVALMQGGRIIAVRDNADLDSTQIHILTMGGNQA